MIITAWAFTVDVNVAAQCVDESVLMGGDNMAAVPWVNRYRGGRKSRAGALMRNLRWKNVRVVGALAGNTSGLLRIFWLKVCHHRTVPPSPAISVPSVPT